LSEPKNHKCPYQGRIKKGNPEPKDCPYLEEIRESRADITMIKEALVGKQFGILGGMEKRLGAIEEQLKSRLTGRDKAVIYAALVTAAVAVVLEIIRNL